MSLGFADDSFKEQVRSSTDLVQLVAESVSLQPRRGGSEFAGLCPFHDDHNPSMVVYPERQTFRCWVCEEGGDCFSWVQKNESVDFREALEILARRANIEIPKKHRRGPAPSPEKPKLYEALKWAEQQFQWYLLNAREAAVARDYLFDRGFTEETIVDFGLGFHPNDWEWILNRARGKFDAKQLSTVWLTKERREGSGYHDNFVNRVMFPIHDDGGRTVAFGGRVLPGDDSSNTGKYINSSDTPLFTKNRVLYALHHARQGIKDSNKAIVVEGYTDCIKCHQFGISNVVATLGTALTENHVIALKRRLKSDGTGRVVLVYDGDAAGQDAAERALTKLLGSDVNLRILTLPDKLDPADFLEQQGTEEFQRRVNAAPEAWEFKLDRLIQRFDMDSVDGRQRVLDQMLELIASASGMSQSLRADVLIGRLSHRLQTDERGVRRRLEELRQRRSRSGRFQVANQNTESVDTQEKTPVPVPDGTRIAEEDIIEGIFDNPDHLSWIQHQIGTDDFARGPRREILELCFDLAEQGVAPSFQNVTATLEDAERKRLATILHDQLKEKKPHANTLDDVHDAEHPSVPAWLFHATEYLKSKRRAIAHEQSKKSIGGATGPLSSDQLEAMRQISESLSDQHRKKRAS